MVSPHQPDGIVIKWGGDPNINVWIGQMALMVKELQYCGRPISDIISRYGFHSVGWGCGWAIRTPDQTQYLS